jgi:hypothetical protein
MLCEFKVFELNGCFMFSCSLCKRDFKLGNFGKKMQNIKFHASSRGHLPNVYAKQPTCDLDSNIKHMFKEIEMKVGTGIFFLKGKNAQCRCCNIEIDLACRGNPVLRTNEHVISKDHKIRQSRNQADKTKDISSFFMKNHKPNESS